MKIVLTSIKSQPDKENNGKKARFYILPPPAAIFSCGNRIAEFYSEKPYLSKIERRKGNGNYKIFDIEREISFSTLNFSLESETLINAWLLVTGSIMVPVIGLVRGFSIRPIMGLVVGAMI